ncbi:SDR family NAD(P)-dependent oxidoreductase, partial [Pinirhizobacter soli]|uniref:SDR family NAD(P)-dependent oxidoreductase n=1 Tax=Pinirhizobacter soli TaxID=2786953 RepID=UPI002029F2F8
MIMNASQMPSQENPSQSIGGERTGDMAIIGMACRFPGAGNYDQYWENLCNGLSSISEVPENRWDKDAFYSTDVRDKNKSVSKWGGFVDGVEFFDADFFGVSAREAEVMDPQQRIMLEQAWACIEDAGYDPKAFSGSNTGVYVGVFNFDYQDHLRKALDTIEGHVSTGTHTALIPNRISYFLNLHGPSLPIDTACSSSLVALHKAAHAIRRGECDYALVGGVSVLCSPTHFISFSKTGMLSPDGSCKTFDERANGYVRGEGAAMILIKPLEKAIRDKDRIAAVLRGTAVNHGGHARTVTYPGSTAQSNVIAEALRQANVPVGSIGYVEAHGTGTPKGDPIEVEGLKMAFSRVAADRGEVLNEQSCGIGSVKTNIGHLESVAGLAGLIKTILCMKHRAFPPLVHYQKLNPRIALDGSPFFIVDTARSWPVPADDGGKAIPRRAGISSFGFGGVNSHVVIEEYVEPQGDTSTEHHGTTAGSSSNPPALIVLSAKSEPALRQRARQLLAALASPDFSHAGLADLAYTLQVGRQAMAARLALVVDSFEALQTRLENWLAQSLPSDEVFHNQISPEVMARAGEAVERDDSLTALLDSGDLKAVAGKWIEGHPFDWTVLHEAGKRRRLALPTYPFAKEKHWIEAKPSMTSASSMEFIHPLVHRNTSNSAGLRFSSIFTGQEFFLADHVVQGERTLPGAAQLEMVRCVASHAIAHGSPHRLKDVVWLRPVVVGPEPKDLHIALFPEGSGKFSFEIYDGAEGDEGVVYSQGSVLADAESREALLHDLAAMRLQCMPSPISAEACYAAFDRMGLSYGPGHRGLGELFVGSGLALARITLPDTLKASQESYVLHPSLVDAALQAAIAFQADSAGGLDNALTLPFALGSLQVLAPLQNQMWAVIRRSAGHRAGDALLKFDIDLCNDDGLVCARLGEFCARATTHAGSDEPPRTALMRLDWTAQPVVNAGASRYSKHLVLLCGDAENLRLASPRLRSGLPDAACFEIEVYDPLATCYESAAATLLELIQSLSGHPGQHLVQLVVPSPGIAQAMAGLGGMLRTAQLENPRIVGQVISVEPGQDVAQALAENRDSLATQIRYVAGVRQVGGWVEQPPLPDAIWPWKAQGAYLITGGAGGLGLIIARDIARQARGARLVLTGRSPLTATIQAKLVELEVLGATAQYRQLDVGNRDAVMQCVQGVAETFGSLHGIVHSAGVLRDSFIIKKTHGELREVLHAKVAGTLHLDEASQELALDCFICFSSTSGALGNVGQADYAAANAFMDAFAHHRAEQVVQGQRHGRTLSINWPLWEEGGMQVDAVTRQSMTEQTGLIPLRSASGCVALSQALLSGLPQVLVAEGAIRRFKSSLSPLAKPATVALKTEDAAANAPSDELQEKAIRYFVRLLSSTLNRPAHSIDARVQMEAYGIDSILVMELTRALEQVFGPLSKTLLFEYQTIAALAVHFLQNHRVRLSEVLGESLHEAPAAASPREEAAPVTVAMTSRRPRFGMQQESFQGANPIAASRDVGDIAIIGVAGRYPQAGNLEQFWANLSQGKDSITEIPSERWDYKLYYDEDRNKPGKTYGKWGGFIDGIDLFDPLFFNISPREAERMDPQERLFLECVHATLEDAGYTRESVTQHASPGQEGSVGVFVGVMYEEYQLYGAQEQARGNNLAMLNSAASVANRISYFCNFNGPSLALDTMCSSSLTAIHLACQSLQRGGCAVAIAGGVNVSVHPNKYLMLAQGKFISGKGRCESFGEGGEGYVPGEGVGAVLLKPLAQAKADGDHIYGVIKATAINHGGKTNGFTVPNPNAQAKVIERALREGGIDARAVSYIEAHGTGTSLGDPIEIAGLSKAFRSWTQDTQFCAIGSAKSNIGHCESAAGIAGVTKVLLQLKHRQLAPSLHSSVLNPNIDFGGTPFVVQQELAPWPKQGGPRIAGISSFGAGGANAHVVIEEYEVPPQTGVSNEGPALVVLSARSEEQLLEQVKQLAAFLELQKEDATLRLDNLAYTLQVGREAMDERLGIVANTLSELQAKLAAHLNGETGLEELYRGQAKRTKDALTALAGDDGIDTLLASWIAQGKHGKLLDLWVKGLSISWDKLYGEARPRRISLPTYPFARERYWIDTTASKGKESAATGVVLHPLVHRNTSSFSTQRFSSHFNGEEFFLADHVVRGSRILPGVAQLEMVRRAVSEAIDENSSLQLQDVAWMRPVVVGTDGIDLHVALELQDDGSIGFELYGDIEDGDIVRYSHGSATAVANASSPLGPAHDLATLRAQSTSSLSAAQCYAELEQSGLQYGPSFQGLGELFIGSQQVLAQIALPAAVQATWEDYVLHPSLLDAALQATIGWTPAIDGANTSSLWLPVALGSLEMMAPCVTSMWAVVRRSAGFALGDASKMFDIDLCDESGSVCIRINRLELRLAKATAEPGQAVQTLLMIPSWEARPVTHHPAVSPAFAHHRVLLCGVNDADGARLQRHMPGAVRLAATIGGDLSLGYEAAAVALLEQLKELSGQPGQHLIQVVAPCDGEGSLLAGLGGMLRTVQLENPRLAGQIIQVQTGQDIAQALAENQGSLATHIRYAGGARHVASWVEYTDAIQAHSPWKSRGVYLITGGAGGLGLIFAREIARQAKGATLILTGRSSLDERIQAHVRELEAQGAVVRYEAVDVADKAAVTQLVRSIPEDHESLDGIIHSAGVVRDSFLIKKTPGQLREVFSAKVAGTLNLDEASADMELDCFIVFSSITGAIGNVGQADYAAANAFMDAFAKYRSDLATLGQRRGRTLSVNWPLWAEGGMQVDDATRQHLLREIGMTPLRTAEGCTALARALSSGAPQVLVVEGLPHRLKATLSTKDAPAEALAPPEADSEGLAAEDLDEKTIRHLVRTLSSTLKLPAHKVDASAPLEAYGIDSVMVMDLTAKLEKDFGPLPKTLFFEYQSIAALSGYFLKQHRSKLVELFGEKAAVAASAAVAKPLQGMRAASILGNRSRFKSRRVPAENEAVAIIGLSGRYPQAGDMEAFWANLSCGRDSITEIPLERWDWQRYYDEDRSKIGTTYSKWGGFLDDVDKFDPLFFNISPREAELMDPQERLFLECVHGALEDAGYTRDSVAKTGAVSQDRSVGVFVGVMYEEYQLYGAQAQARGQNVSVSNSAASIANRISYFCNFNGPSLALDTMCSSSLTAIHLACQSLQRGSCAVAIAGGVNVSIHPNKYLMLAQGKFISGKGRCESFGQGGEGYVPGEGVGAVLLKPLTQAIADGDHIYGIIKATAINHGGKTNGYTVPNPNAQAQVIEQALREGGVDARQISYIEAHGTGTSLGDPIEIAGLSKAFGQWTQDTQYCAIGSAKSNIGHCESAAGIAGVTKVLLQMKHRQLVPSLHSSVLNPNIDFAGTPFVVQQALSPWERPTLEKDGVTRTYPRMAGVSSFGAGGANAHVVIEEYEAPPHADVPHEGPALVVLSARSEVQLQLQVARLAAFLEVRREDATLRLDELAYTLQVGREALDERFALVAGSMEELREKLSLYTAGEAAIEDLYRGQVKRAKEVLSALVGDEDIAGAVETWIAKGKFGKLLELWVRGLSVEWTKLYGEVKPRRISLPTYPFARERYWIQTGGDGAVTTTGNGAVLHPLLHRNTSDVTGLRFSTHLSGEEFFLADHVVQGARILPGAAQLEMARCAAREALGEDEGLQLRDIAWIRPVVVGTGGLDLHIALYPEETGELPFEVYGEGEEGESVLYSQGAIALVEPMASVKNDLSVLHEQCNLFQLDTSQCYAIFEKMGLHYGPSFQGLGDVFVGHGQVLARITLPAQAPNKGYGLHPSLLDAALQATLGLQVGVVSEMAGVTLMLPFALGALEVLRPCPSSMWAVVRHSPDSKAGAVVQQLDVDLCDEHGVVCVRFRRFSLRPMTNVAVPALPRPAVPPVKVEASIRTLLFQPTWHSRPAVETADPGYARQVVLLGVEAADVERHLPGVACIRLTADEADPSKSFDAAASILLEQLQTMNRQPGKHLLQVVIPDHGTHRTMQGLGGMLRTAQLENPRLVGQLICVEPGQDIAKALLESRADDAHHVRYIHGERQVAGWAEYIGRAQARSPWKSRGVYLITGGAGGLGLIFAREIATQVRNPVLILTGRSQLNKDIQAHIRQLEMLGAVVRYHAVDVADAAALTDLVHGIPEEFESFDGIIHSAGVIRDGFIAGKTQQQLREVLSAKVTGTRNLDQASRDMPLDCFICFSSMAGAMGNAGQADYAAANAFMDAFAHERGDLVAQGLRHGRTLSVNWPLWDEGGMQVDAATRAMLIQQLGMHALSSDGGVQALHQAMASGSSQVLVMAGDATRIREVLLGKSKEAVAAQPTAAIKRHDSTASQGTHAPSEPIKRALVEKAAALIKVKPEDIDDQTSLSEYGFDSITFTELANVLNQQYRLELKPTIFFEYPTLAELAGYLVREHQGTLFPSLGDTNRTVHAAVPGAVMSTPEPVPLSVPVLKRRVTRGWRRSSAAAASAPAIAPRFDVAIIGLSGRYPGAADVNRFWDNLVAARNSIVEVPPERWDNNRFYDAKKQQPGRTYSKWAGLLDDADCFDRLFFNITPREAQLISPQERLFMQEVYASIEDAGYTPDSLCQTRKIGAFVGVLNESYATGVRFWSIANRISYLLNFQGPSMAVDTACSSSLTAVHLAIESLRSGDSEVAIAGGVNLLVTPDHMIGLSALDMLSGGDQCKPFAADCDGFVDSEAVGALVLKPLHRAVADGDHIYGVIKGSAINSGGKSHSYMTPNPNMQAKLVSDALQRAGVEARAVSYVEAQGTGSHMGDPIEIAGLSKAFRNGTQDKQFCAIGSVKSNVGHSESASGFVAISKVLMQMKHQTLVPSLHAETLNPNINFADSPFVVQRTLADWPRPMLDIDGHRREFPRVAGISSFGAGGANAHLVIEEYLVLPDKGQAPKQENDGPAMVVLSAHDPERLQEQVQRLLVAVAPAPAADLSLANVAYTLQIGREAMEERLAFLVDSFDDLRLKLTAYAAGKVHGDGVYRGHAKRHAMSILSGDEVMDQAVQAWVARGMFGKLLELWVKGFTFDWNVLYEASSGRPSRVSLPTYPFARERYWTDVPYPDMAEVPTDARQLRTPPAVEPSIKQDPAPELGHEQAMIRIWQELFGRPSIEVDDHFFELGGDSLLATQLVSRVHGTFGIEMPVSAIFETPILTALVQRIEELDAATAETESLEASSGIRPILRNTPLSLSFAQQRLWFLDQYEARREIYNIPATVHLVGRLDVDVLSYTLNEIVRRHEALRTSFAIAGDEPVQRVEPALPLALETVDLSDLSPAEREVQAHLRVQKEVTTPFDLVAGPLIRFSLMRLAEEDHILLLTMHHIVSDGWSMGVVAREMVALYGAFIEGRPSPLPELPIQYADFAHWQREWLKGEVLERQLGYWKRQLAQ